MKKILSIIVSLCLTLSFVGCSNTSGTVQQQSLSVSREEFLFDLQKGLQERWDAVESDPNTNKTIEEEISFNAKLVDIEYKYLNRYFNCTFSDSDFQIVAEEYLKALQGQYDITRTTDYNEETFITKWDEYYKTRLNLIKNFYENFGLNIDDKYNETLYNLKIDANKKKIPQSTVELLNGKWEYTNSNTYEFIFNNYEVAKIVFYDNHKKIVTDKDLFSLSADNEGNVVLRTSGLSAVYQLNFLESGQIKITDMRQDLEDYVNKERVYSKISDETIFPELSKEPYIGMTRAELEKSLWGNPKKINTTTTTGGTTEQWIYDRPYNNKAYVYLTNGIVTTIQKR